MKKNIIFKILIAICLIALISISGIFAYLSYRTDAVTNEFTLGKVSCDIDEDFNDVLKKDVVVLNTGDSSSYIRSKVLVNWVAEDGKSFYSEKPELGTHYYMDINTDDWTLIDGYYYHNTDVKVGGSTEVLITEAYLIEGADVPDGYKLCIEIVSSAIQANPKDAIIDAWGVDLSVLTS